MTSPATQEPCPACGYNGAGFYQPEAHPCAESFHRTGRWEKPAPPSQRAELLTQEHLRLALNTVNQPYRDALKQHIAALTQRVGELEQSRDLYRDRQSRYVDFLGRPL